jgi:hypothetical protein
MYEHADKTNYDLIHKMDNLLDLIKTIKTKISVLK